MISRDFDGSYRIKGYEELKFSSEMDARNAIELAVNYFIERHVREMAQEYRYRRAAERGARIAAAEGV